MNRADRVVDWVAAQRFWLLMVLAFVSLALASIPGDAAWKPFDVTFLIGSVLVALWTMPE